MGIASESLGWVHPWIRLAPLFLFFVWGLSIRSTRFFAGAAGVCLIAAGITLLPNGYGATSASVISPTCITREVLWALVIGLQLLVPLAVYRFAGQLLDAGFQGPRAILGVREVSRLYGVLFAAMIVSLDGHLVVFESAILWASDPPVSCAVEEPRQRVELWLALAVVGDGLRVGALLGAFVALPAVFLNLFLASMERLYPWLWGMLDTRSALQWGIWGCVLLSLAILFEKAPLLVLEAIEGADALVESRSP